MQIWYTTHSCHTLSGTLLQAMTRVCTDGITVVKIGHIIERSIGRMLICPFPSSQGIECEFEYIINVYILGEC